MGRMIEIGGRRNARILAGAASCLLSAALSVVVAYGQVPPQRLAPEGASPPIAVTPPVAPPTPAPEQQSPATPSEQKPGWFDTLGHWFDESVTNVNKGWDNVNKGLNSTLGAVGGQATDTTKSAAEAASNMAKGAAKGAADGPGKRCARLRPTARRIAGARLKACAKRPASRPAAASTTSPRRNARRRRISLGGARRRANAKPSTLSRARCASRMG